MDYYGDCEEFDIGHTLVSWENTLPYSEGVEEGEVLGVEEGNPSETIEERVDF